MYYAIAFEERNKPTATLCNQGFINDARSAASSKGVPGIRVVSETVPPGCTVVEDVEAGVAAAMDNIVATLTRPLTAEERSPRPRDSEKFTRIIFKGNLQEVNRFFYRRGWTDGLPVIPPTEEAVAEMLTGTDLPPDYLIGKMLPRLGKATVEKVAINAVMAGALPTYMPLLIAGVQALLDPITDAHGWAVSVGSWAPFWIINGPIRHDLHVNSGVGALSPGDIANAAIGRAMGLITKNMRGTRKGIEDMGTLGNPMKYAMVAAENEEESPWEPLHVEQGFNKADSTVSLFFPNSFIHGGRFPNVIYHIPPVPGVTCLMVTPQHAKDLARDGWTKKDIKSYIYEYARIPFYQHSSYPDGSPVIESMEKKSLPANPQDYVRLIPNPEALWLFIAGGPGGGLGVMKGSPRMKAGEKRVNLVTKKITLPANWDKLVAKYSDIVPKYGMY